MQTLRANKPSSPSPFVIRTIFVLTHNLQTIEWPLPVLSLYQFSSFSASTSFNRVSYRRREAGEEVDVVVEEDAGAEGGRGMHSPEP